MIYYNDMKANIEDAYNIVMILIDKYNINLEDKAEELEKAFDSVFDKMEQGKPEEMFINPSVDWNNLLKVLNTVRFLMDKYDIILENKIRDLIKAFDVEQKMNSEQEKK